MRTLVGVGLVLLVAALPGVSEARLDPGAEPPDTVRWGGRDFSTAAGLAAWLEARGLSYARWAANHPGAAARLEGRGPGTAEPTAGRRTPAPAAVPVAQASRSFDSVLLIGVLVTLAAALLIAAATPPRLLAFLHAPELVGEHRPELAAAGTALAVALGAAYLL